jgi:hypothetical protein
MYGAASEFIAVPSSLHNRQTSPGVSNRVSVPHRDPHAESAMVFQTICAFI